MADETPTSKHSADVVDEAEEAAEDTSATKTSGTGGASVEKKSDSSRKRPSIGASDIKAGADKIRGWLATIVWVVAVVCALILAVGALLVALKWANEDNNLVTWVTDSADWLAGPLGNVFEFTKENGKADESKNALVNWGLAAVVYLVVGKIAQRIIQP